MDIVICLYTIAYKYSLERLVRLLQSHNYNTDNDLLGCCL